MSEIPVFDCLCQNCNLPFKFQKILINCINFDNVNNLYDDLLSFKLNEVTCPYCKSTFTYEIPMIIISFKYRFIIKINPSVYENPKISPAPPFRLFNDNFKYREVAYQIEGVEKARIFSDGESDIFIEWLKFCMFSDDDTLPFDETNLVYTHSDSKYFYFSKYNSDNKLINSYSLSKDTKTHKQPIFNEDKFNWNIINRNTFKNFINEKENSNVNN